MPTVLITGANRGIGLSFAKAYLAKGWEVHVANRRPIDESSLSLDGEAEKRFHSHFLDLSDFSTIEALGQALSDISLDLVISNAALTGGELGVFGDTDYKRFEQCLKVNTMAPMRLAECLAESVASSEGKTIFFMGSRLGASPFFGYSGYMISKTALNGVVMQTSMALRPRDVTVVAAHPGWVGTEATASHGQAPLTPDMSAEMLMKIIDGLTIEDTGSFFDPDGSKLPLVTQQTEQKFYGKPKGATK